MRECSKCGVARALSDFNGHSRQCRICRNAYKREWGRKNRDKQYRGRDTPEYRERQRAYHREWYKANRETERAKQTAYSATRSAELTRKAVAWQRANPEKYRAIQRAAKARRQGVPMDADAKTYAQLLLTDPCSYCGGPAGEIDHIVPVTRQGTGDWDNLTSACRSCNAQKNAKPLLAFLAA